MANVAGIRFQVETADSREEIKSLRKELQQMFDNAKVGGKVWREAGDAIDYATKRLNESNTAARKAKTETMDAYFNMGTALRKFYMEQRVGDRTMREAIQTTSIFTNALGLSGLSGGLGQVATAAQQTEFVIGSLGIAAQSAGGKFSGMGKVLMELAGPLSAVGAFGGAVLFINSEVSRMSTELQKATDELIDLKVELGEISKLGVLNQRMARAQESEPNISLWDRIVSAVSAPLGGNAYAAMAGKAATDKQKLIDSLQVQINKYLEEAYGVTITGKRGGTVEPGINYSPSDYFIKKQVQRGGSVLSAKELSGKGSYIGKSSGMGIGIGIRGSVSAPGTVPELPAEYAHAQEVVVELNQGIITMGNTLSNSLAQGFIKGFQKGESVLGAFTEAILTSMANIAAQQAAAAGVAGLLSLIPGVGSFGSIFSALGGLFKFAGGGVISEPVYGVGAKSKRGYLIGESGPEMVSPLNGMPSGQNGLLRGLSRVEQAIYSLNLRVDNMGLWMGSERGRIAFENAR